MTGLVFFTASGSQRQQEIYRQGLAGEKPRQPVAIEGLEEAARQKLSPEAFDYVAGGAGAEDTVRANREAFRRWRIVPRFLRNVAQRDLRVQLFGQDFPAPVLLAPIGVLGILHEDGELAVARAARSLGVPMILSTLSSHALETVARESGDGPRWFQLYWPNHPELAASWLARAERANFAALVVTLDTFHLAWRERDLQHAYLPFLRGDGLANYFTDPAFHAAMGGDPRADPGKAIECFGRLFSNPALTWSDLAFLREHWRRPILLKGVLHPEDARKALDHGVEGVVVSNHGGRQVDGAIPALDALPAIADAVGGRLTVLFDSGIRRGADAFKALALGAQAVLLGRPYCYGLAVRGEEGVRDVVKNFIADFDLTLGLAGCASANDLNRDLLAKVRDQ